MSGNFIKRMQYGPEYLDWYYNGGGMAMTFSGLASIYGESMMSEYFQKAAINASPWDPPAGTNYTNYFDPVYSAKVGAYVARSDSVYRLLRKTTFLAEGDSLKYYETDLNNWVGLAAGGTPFATATGESAPTISTLTELKPAFLVDPWITDFQARVISTWQNRPELDPNFVKRHHTELIPNDLDVMLTQDIDTVANDGSAAYNLESIDRMISTDGESHTTFCNVATDGDLYWGNSSAKIDRDADTDNTFGCGAGTAGDGLSMPGSAAARVLSLDYIDDVIAASMRYSKNNNYICVTGPKTLNEVNKLIDPKQRFADAPMDVQITMNGVSTRKGTEAGFSVASYITNGLQIPIFTNTNICGAFSGNQTTKITDNDIGHMYFIDMDEMELRIAVPMTYLETPPPSMLTGDKMQIRHMFLFAAQLFGGNMRAHAGVKYLKST